MATQLTIVNNVLRRLREDTVTSVNDNAYSQLIAMFVNDGLREVQDAYDWQSLWSRIRVDVAAGNGYYDLSKTVSLGGSVYDADTPTTMQSMIRFDANNRAQCYLYDSSSDDTLGIQPALVTNGQFKLWSATDKGETGEWPNIFTIFTTADGTGWAMSLYPTPDTNKYMEISWWIPQDELAIDGTDDDTLVVPPNHPIEAYAHMRAANERGEEIGEPGNLLELRYANVLGAAIETASAHDGRANHYESRRD